MGKKKGLQRVKEYADNQVLLIALGAHNDNLKRLEKNWALKSKRAAIKSRSRGKKKPLNTLFGNGQDLCRRREKGDIDNSDIDNALHVSEGRKMTSKEKQSLAGEEEDLTLRTRKRHIQPRSQTQAEYVRAMRDYEMVFGLGPAGTGKTFLAVAKAVALMIEGQIDKIILSRPAVEAGENLGFLPGDLKEKIDPYLRPLYDALYDMLPHDVVDKKLELGEIEVAPLAFMRGRTLTNAMVILDEAQNTTPMQMKMFLTRMGENSRMVINGDLSQTDLPRGVQSGLADALDVLRNVKDIAVVTFTEKTSFVTVWFPRLSRRMINVMRRVKVWPVNYDAESRFAY